MDTMIPIMAKRKAIIMQTLTMRKLAVTVPMTQLLTTEHRIMRIRTMAHRRKILITMTLMKQNRIMERLTTLHRRPFRKHRTTASLTMLHRSPLRRHLIMEIPDMMILLLITQATEEATMISQIMKNLTMMIKSFSPDPTFETACPYTFSVRERNPPKNQTD